MVRVLFIHFEITLLKLKISEGARTQIITPGPFWLSTALYMAHKVPEASMYRKDYQS